MLHSCNKRMNPPTHSNALNFKNVLNKEKLDTEEYILTNSISVKFKNL